MQYVRLKLLEGVPVGVSSVFLDDDQDQNPSYPCLFRWSDDARVFTVLICGEDASGAWGYNLSYGKRTSDGWFRWVFPTGGKKGEWVADPDPVRSIGAVLALERRIAEVSKDANEAERYALENASLISRTAIVPFGRYRGMTVGQMMQEDYRYFEWMTGKEEFVKEIIIKI